MGRLIQGPGSAAAGHTPSANPPRDQHIGTLQPGLQQTPDEDARMFGPVAPSQAPGGCAPRPRPASHPAALAACPAVAAARRTALAATPPTEQPAPGPPRRTTGGAHPAESGVLANASAAEISAAMASAGAAASRSAMASSGAKQTSTCSTNARTRSDFAMARNPATPGGGAGPRKPSRSSRRANNAALRRGQTGRRQRMLQQGQQVAPDAMHSPPPAPTAAGTPPAVSQTSGSPALSSATMPNRPNSTATRPAKIPVRGDERGTPVRNLQRAAQDERNGQRLLLLVRSRQLEESRRLDDRSVPPRLQRLGRQQSAVQQGGARGGNQRWAPDGAAHRPASHPAGSAGGGARIAGGCLPARPTTHQGSSRSRPGSTTCPFGSPATTFSSRATAGNPTRGPRRQHTRCRRRRPPSLGLRIQQPSPGGPPGSSDPFQPTSPARRA